MLIPRKRKFRKEHRGSMRGKATRCNTIAHGEIGLKVLEPAWITNRQIESARIAISGFLRRSSSVYIRIFPHKPVTKKPSESRQGGGKGDPEFYVAVVKPGTIIFEIGDVSKDLGIEAFRRAARKLPVKTCVLTKEGSIVHV